MINIPEGHTKLTLFFCLIKSDSLDVEKMRLGSCLGQSSF